LITDEYKDSFLFFPLVDEDKVLVPPVMTEGWLGGFFEYKIGFYSIRVLKEDQS